MPRPDARVLLVEFNELDPALLEAGIARGELPAFARLRARSELYVTETLDETLEPWVQWVTLHTGVPQQRHGIVQLLQGPSVQQPFVWERLSAAGHRVWVCGAMNAREREGLNGSVLLDYWSPPREGSPFHDFSRFVHAVVSRRIDERQRLPWHEALMFLRFMMRHGLRLSTAWRAVSQLTTAIVTRTSWRLVFVLEDCQLDLFLHQYRRIEPAFAVFFANSVAHLQHNYWREMQPERFAEPPAPGRLRHRRAIPAGYRHLDRMLGRILRAAGDGAAVVLCTALGQRPFRPAGDETGTLLYRVDDLAALVRALSLPPPSRLLRTMADAFTLEYADGATAAAALERLQAATVASGPLFIARTRDAQAILVDVAPTREIDGSEPICIDGGPLGVTFAQLLSIGHHKSGEHHPLGLLWVSGKLAIDAPAPQRAVPLTVIAPSIELFFGLPGAGGRE